MGWVKKWRRLSMRGFLVVLVCSILLPALIFASILFWRYYESALAQVDQELLSDARQLAHTVDRDLVGLQSTLLTLTTAASLRREDYAAFHRQLSEVRDYIGVNILVRSPEGQQLANTRQPYGSPLPFEPLTGDKEVLASRKPYISNLIVGAVAKTHLYTITAPVIENGEVTHFLNLSIPLQRLVDLIEANRDPQRLSGILDRDGRLMVRLPEQDAYVGKRGPIGFFESVPGTEGTWQGNSINGLAVRSAYATSNAAGWVIWVALPDAAARASLNRTMYLLAALGLVLTALGVLAAYIVGGRLSRSINSLKTQAAIVGQGGSVTHLSLPVREIDDVSNSLAAASRELTSRAAQRDRAEKELRDLSESLEQTVADRTRDLISEMQRREETEQTLRQIQKMEAIGQLTGGVAHDFNNMLGVVIGNLDLAQRRRRTSQNIDGLIDNALEGARRAASLTQRLLAFARQQPLEPKPVEVNSLVAGMSELLRRSLGEAIALETVLAGGLWRVHVDANQIESALLNLAVNARDAMPAGGKLTLETSNAHFDDAYARRERVGEGQYVLIAVTDTGDGMSKDVLAKAFDPFFTTKEAGAGTGLGLSQVYGFVKQSGGHVKIYSEQGQGTTVKVYLPRYTGSEPLANPAEPDAEVPLGRRDITILVVEDEAGVRASTCEMMRELGYSVLEAENSAAALRLLDSGAAVDLLFTDVVMPETNGRKLAEVALVKRPGLKVLFTTGYTKNAIVHNATLDPGVNFIGKPFTLAQAARKVAEALK